MQFVALFLLEMVFMAGVTFGAAATTIPFNLGLLLLSLSMAFELFAVRWENNRRRLAVVRASASILVIVATLLGAHFYRPTKITEQMLDRPITLQEREMTLERLAFEAQTERDRFGGRIEFTFAEADKDLIVRWPAESMTLREFIVAIESQTPLRHRFGHCGNGITILYGGDCVFGLWIRDPTLMGPDPARKIYDGGSYFPPEGRRI